MGKKKMKDFQSCFSEYGVQVADSFTDSGSKMIAQNLVTCLYQAKVAGVYCIITVSWCKSLMGQGLSVSIDDYSSQCSCKVDLKPWSFWKKKGSKTFEVGDNKVDVVWDLSIAKYGSGPEPKENYVLVVSTEREIVLLLGDMYREGYRKMIANKPTCADTILISRREHLYGKGFYSTKVQLSESGSMHDILIECQLEGQREAKLAVKVDQQKVLQVKKLRWNFRGNHTIIVDGLPVELLWDVHNWLFNPNDAVGVFMFQTSLPSDKFCSNLASSNSLLQWQQIDKCKDVKPPFSLLIYAWRSD